MNQIKPLENFQYEDLLAEYKLETFRAIKNGLGMIIMSYSDFPTKMLIHKDVVDLGTWGRQQEGDTIPLREYLGFLMHRLTPDNDDLRIHLEAFTRITLSFIDLNLSIFYEKFSGIPALKNSLVHIGRVASFLRNGEYNRNGIDRCAVDIKAIGESVKDMKIEKDVSRSLKENLKELEISIRLLRALPNEVLEKLK